MGNSDSTLSKEQQKLLKAFKKQIGVVTTAKSVAPVEKIDVVEDDRTIFLSALHGVVPMPKQNQVQPTKPQRPVVDAQILAKRAAAEGPVQTEHVELSDTQAILNPVGSQSKLSYRIATLQHRVFEDLKAGNLRWYEAVDLHGCTVEQARSAVLQVIEMAKAENQNVVKVVHGKGPDALLKSYVNGWLRQHRDVLAFVSAPEQQGGTGAVLVLLKRAEKNPKYDRTQQRA
ncbi:Smr/MutS family protein [Acinetobacter larvae]|uniref:DNA mismatch repair protein MutS n=1 Tax=Acinetobacter larvae TaxID=1789224 RepID=A0A1B2M0X8_9GAMM|nr:Smr/MutS family protein [Acinetobacter larvae]AOA58811.1 DNA mismatch repair protein MutS [Acinetobacter larvae]